MFERPRGGVRALLVNLDLGEPDQAARISELQELAASCGLNVVGLVQGRRAGADWWRRHALVSHPRGPSGAAAPDRPPPPTIRNKPNKTTISPCFSI